MSSESIGPSVGWEGKGGDGGDNGEEVGEEDGRRKSMMDGCSHQLSKEPSMDENDAGRNGDGCDPLSLGRDDAVRW